MKRYQFKCLLKSDIVLNASSASEGNSEVLDYIPGSKFLGIAAGSLYDMVNGERTADIFHNGKVFFGDAHQIINDERTVKTPFAWFVHKGAGLNEGVQLSYEVTPEQKIKNSKNGIQLKQVSNGYIAPNQQKYISQDLNFSVKSAYDSEKRKAQDTQMFGYYALPKGSEWSFTISCENTVNFDLIKESLSGLKRVGRSRSAQYGLVEITFDREQSNEQFPTELKSGRHYFYASSNWCFYDGYQRNTVKPTVELLGLPKNSKINWDLSQVKSRMYQTWNNKRYNRDADRYIIERGSVLVIDLDENTSIIHLQSGVGSHRNEGFGELVINPKYLNKKEVAKYKLTKFEGKQKEKLGFVSKGKQDEQILQLLNNKSIAFTEDLDLDKKVNSLVALHNSLFKGINKSQWGQIRKFGKWASNEQTLLELLFNNKTGYLYHGKIENQWIHRGRREILKTEIESISKGSRIAFTIKFAAQMAKQIK